MCLTYGGNSGQVLAALTVISALGSADVEDSAPFLTACLLSLPGFPLLTEDHRAPTTFRSSHFQEHWDSCSGWSVINRQLLSSLPHDLVSFTSRDSQFLQKHETLWVDLAPPHHCRLPSIARDTVNSHPRIENVLSIPTCLHTVARGSDFLQVRQNSQEAQGSREDSPTALLEQMVLRNHEIKALHSLLVTCSLQIRGQAVSVLPYGFPSFSASLSFSALLSAQIMFSRQGFTGEPFEPTGSLLCSPVLEAPQNKASTPLSLENHSSLHAKGHQPGAGGWLQGCRFLLLISKSPLPRMPGL